jgi:hypothetical protein
VKLAISGSLHGFWCRLRRRRSSDLGDPELLRNRYFTSRLGNGMLLGEGLLTCRR